jgi:hypothetical protein
MRIPLDLISTSVATDGKQAELGGEQNVDPGVVAAGLGQRKMSNTAISLAMPAANLTGEAGAAKKTSSASKARPRGAGVSLVGPFLARLRAEGAEPEAANP